MDSARFAGMPQEERLYDGIARFSDYNLREVQKDRRLIIDGNPGELMDEFYDAHHDIRLIAVPGEGDTARRHTELMEARLPVFSSFYTEEGIMVMQVPLGTKPLSKMLPSIIRSPQDFQPIFKEIGSIMQQAIDNGFGAPCAFTDRPILSQFALSLEGNLPSGGRVYLVPPYTFEQQEISQEAVVQIYGELERFIGRGNDGRAADITHDLIEAVTWGMGGEA